MKSVLFKSAVLSCAVLYATSASSVAQTEVKEMEAQDYLTDTDRERISNFQGDGLQKRLVSEFVGQFRRQGALMGVDPKLAVQPMPSGEYSEAYKIQRLRALREHRERKAEEVRRMLEEQKQRQQQGAPAYKSISKEEAAKRISSIFTPDPKKQAEMTQVMLQHGAVNLAFNDFSDATPDGRMQRDYDFATVQDVFGVRKTTKRREADSQEDENAEQKGGNFFEQWERNKGKGSAQRRNANDIRFEAERKKRMQEKAEAEARRKAEIQEKLTSPYERGSEFEGAMRAAPSSGTPYRPKFTEDNEATLKVKEVFRQKEDAELSEGAYDPSMWMKRLDEAKKIFTDEEEQNGQKKKESGKPQSSLEPGSTPSFLLNRDYLFADAKKLSVNPEIPSLTEITVYSSTVIPSSATGPNPVFANPEYRIAAPHSRVPNGHISFFAGRLLAGLVNHFAVSPARAQNTDPGRFSVLSESDRRSFSLEAVEQKQSAFADIAKSIKEHSDSRLQMSLPNLSNADAAAFKNPLSRSDRWTDIGKVLSGQKEAPIKNFSLVPSGEIKKAPVQKEVLPPAPVHADATPEIKYLTTFFISESMGQEQILNLMRAYAADPTVRFLLKGWNGKGPMDTALKWVWGLARQVENPPAVAIDPQPFEQYGVNVVPAMLVQEVTISSAPSSEKVTEALNVLSNLGEFLGMDKGTKSRVRDALSEQISSQKTESRDALIVFGVTSRDWAKTQIKGGADFNQGVRGPTFPIIERALEEIAKERIEKIDWEAKKKEAFDRYWTNQEKQFSSIPPANADRERFKDPSIIIKQDIGTLGKPLYRKGDRVNPLDVRPLTKAIVVFDAADARQIEIVSSLVKKARDSGRALVLISTRFNSAKGEKHVKELNDLWEEPVYLLTPEVRARFDIRVTPSVVTMAKREKMFRISEFDVNGKTAFLPD